MENIKDKISRNKFLPGFILSICRRGRLDIGFLFFFYINYCTAQTSQPVMMESMGNGNKQLSGIYFSKASIVEKRTRSASILPSGFPDAQHYKEVIEKRTATSRTFEDNNGGIVIQYSSENLNYSDSENKFQPINTSLTSFISSSENDKGMGFLAATQQQFPTYLYKDGSTALSLDEKNKIIFNRNCKINERAIDVSDYTVGEDGMFIKNVITSIDKKIFFYQNRIETDYIISQPVNLNNEDLIISEEIQLPEGCYLSLIPPSLEFIPTKEGERAGVRSDYVVYSSDNKEKARFRAPVFYDANNVVLLGKYNLIQQAGKITLQIIVPEKWLNDVKRSYPVTIDPVVTGPISNYPATYMNSCEFPNFQKDSILVTIPANITITQLIVEDSYFADLLATPTPTLLDGYMSLSTVCGSLILSCSDPEASSLPGTCYIVPNTDFKSYLACCFTPSCSIQTFYLTHGFARSNLGPGCNQDYIYYSPVSDWPFSAYIVGKTVETAQSQWSVFPTTICSDSCIISLKVSTNYGVPPYTVTHPWATGSYQYGTSVSGCNSTGTDTITLTIPNCPYTCGTDSTLSIPPPIIVDVCGNAVSGLSPKSIVVKPVPVATAPSVSVCSGSPLNIPVASCVTGSSFQWTGDNGSNGAGNINDLVFNTGPTLITVNYSVIPTANGCIGAPITVSAEIDTLPIINCSLNDTIEPGAGTQLNASGGLDYLWIPSSGLSCTNCSNPLATPVITTTYYVTGTNEYGCSSSDTVTVFVTQGNGVLYIPNSFSPNGNYLNDLFYVYGSSIKSIDIQIYDRWGKLIFRTHDITMGWDGKFRGKYVEGDVYVYRVHCEWLSGDFTYRNGIVTVLR